MDTDTRPNLARQKEEQDLAQLAIDGGLISPEQVQQAWEIQREHGGELQDIFIDQRMATARDLAAIRSLAMNVPYIDLRRHTVKPEVLELVRPDMARKHLLVPLDIIDDTLIVVMVNPEDFSLIQDLEVQAGMSISPALGIEAEIRDTIEECYRIATEDAVAQKAPSPPIDPSPRKRPVSPEPMTHTSPSQTLDALVVNAVRDGASDIHIEPHKDGLRVRYRVDGALVEAGTIPAQARETWITRLKVLTGMNITETKRPQDAEFPMEIAGTVAHIRVAIMPVAGGEKVTLRIPRKAEIRALPDLGLGAADLSNYRSMLNYSSGLILVAGPTGSGKTTTLYGSIGDIDRSSLSVMTIEDPVECTFPDISQSQVSAPTGMTFATGLQAILRHDPDVVMIGRLDDPETAEIAVRAAMTGHLILAAIDAKDAAGALYRLVDLGVEPHQVGATVIGALAQRVSRCICTRCSARTPLTEDEATAYQAELSEQVSELYRGAGCHACDQTGLHGRTGIFEVLRMNPGIERLLRENASPEDIKAQAIAEGMTTIRHDGMVKTRSGILTVTEVMRATM